jgi:hypothetical protein
MHTRSARWDTVLGEGLTVAACQMYVYVCVHTYAHTHVHTYKYTYTHTYKYMYTYILTNTHIHIYICMYIHTQKYNTSSAIMYTMPGGSASDFKIPSDSSEGQLYRVSGPV